MSDDGRTESVVALVNQIPPARVVTYGDLGEASHVGARRVGQILARQGHELAWWRVVDASGRPPAAAQEAAAQHYEAEGTPFHRVGRRVVVELLECRWPLARGAHVDDDRS